MESTKHSLSTPVKSGVIIGIVYCILIFIENKFVYANPLGFSVSKLLFYLLIMGALFYSGFLYRKESGGYITFKECLAGMLVAILIIEFFYLIFSTAYVKFIEPAFIDKLKATWLSYFISHNIPQDKIDEAMKNFNDAGKITFGTLFRSYGFSIIIDAIFAIIFAAILKKKKPEFEIQA